MEDIDFNEELLILEKNFPEIRSINKETMLFICNYFFGLGMRYKIAEIVKMIEESNNKQGEERNNMVSLVK